MIDDDQTYEEVESDDVAVITLKSRGVTVDMNAEAEPGGESVTPAPHPDEPFLVRHKWWVLGGAIAIALLAIVLVYLLLFRDTSKSQAVTILIDPSARVSNISADVGNATTVAAFNRAVSSVSRAQSAVDSAKQSAQQIGNDEVRAGTLALLGAEDELLDAYDNLGSLNRLSGDAASEATETVDDAADAVQRAVSNLQTQELEEAPHPYPNLRLVNGAVRTLEQITSG
ncbi:MAG: hypothetical protein JHD02_04285 [Thermoleophilaceae bacterium]|nr:hypothetical protein [Thermoleophilaceae bacterium]